MLSPGLEHMGQRHLVKRVTATVQYAYLTHHILSLSGSIIKQTLLNRALFQNATNAFIKMFHLSSG
jgi:hypothetical protein